MSNVVEVNGDLFTVQVLQDVVDDVEVFVEVAISEVAVEHVEVLMEGGQGPAGLSAYQIAKNYGFVGTEQQWLESIGGQPVYLGKTLVREGGKLTAVRMYDDADKTTLAKTLHLVEVSGVLSSIETRDAQGVLIQTKTLQRDAQGVLVGVAYVPEGNN